MRWSPWPAKPAGWIPSPAGPGPSRDSRLRRWSTVMSTIIGTSCGPRDELPNRSLWRNLDRLDSQLLAADFVGILSDADGTLSEIKDHPELAEVPAPIPELLGQLNKIYPLVAVVSGRR